LTPPFWPVGCPLAPIVTGIQPWCSLAASPSRSLATLLHALCLSLHMLQEFFCLVFCFFFLPTLTHLAPLCRTGEGNHRGSGRRQYRASAKSIFRDLYYRKMIISTGCIPHVFRWSCLVLYGFINWQRDAPTHQDGVTLSESRISTCVWRTRPFPFPSSFRSCLFVTLLDTPAPHEQHIFCNKAHLSRR
jgi:hypothetical protein